MRYSQPGGGAVISAPTQFFSIITVSYTHLDVYKRQVIDTQTNIVVMTGGRERVKDTGRNVKKHSERPATD